MRSQEPESDEASEDSQGKANPADAGIPPETPSKYLKTNRRAELFKDIGGVEKFTYPPRTPKDKGLNCGTLSDGKTKERSPPKVSPDTA